MSVPWWLPFGAVPEVAPRELLQQLGSAAPPLVLDVRTRSEFEGGHVAGAVNVPVTALAGSIDALNLDPGRRVVAICLTAHRSVPAVRLLHRRGLAALQLAGGMRAWRALGLPEERTR